MARLQDYYRKNVVPDLMKKFGYKTSMQVPRIRKITLNMGVGETTTDKKILDNAVADLSKIAGQKPVVTKAKKSIAVFKIRKDFPDRKSTRLNSSHGYISYAVFCLKKKKQKT